MPTMPSVSRVKKAPTRYVPPFESGDRMDQKTFHSLYRQTPPGFKAELIGGIVFVASPVSVRHGRPHRIFGQWVGAYTDGTPGTDSFDNVTSILTDENEPQPDLSVIVEPAAGGQTRVNTEDLLDGPPELAIEVANTTAAIDLHAKLRAYERYGVREYLVLVIREREVRWFRRRKGRFAPVAPDAAGMIKSSIFPGLWLQVNAAFDRTATRLLATLQQGLASPEHAKFVAKLAKKMG